MYLIFCYNETPLGGTRDLWGVSPTKTEADKMCDILATDYECVECLDCSQFVGKPLTQLTERKQTNRKETTTNRIQGYGINDILQKLQEGIKPRDNDLGGASGHTDWLL